MFLRNQFKADGAFDMPVIKKQDISLEGFKLIGYDQTSREDDKSRQSFVHFFMDDYKFEVIWKDPEPRLEKLKKFSGVLSPQFSTYYTMPASMQIYNTFRSRWCGAYLQLHGVRVIPTVSWGKPQSYWYCFDGIEKGSVVAVSTLGVKKEKDFFLQGYGEMLRRIEPKAIICYCEPFPEMKGNIVTVDYGETNSLTGKDKIWRRVFDPYGGMEESKPDPGGIYIRKTVGYVISAGMGGGNFKTWANDKTLEDHFDRHGKDFNSHSESEYAQQAHQFYENKSQYQIKYGDDGVIRVYDPITNTLGVYNSDGKTITFFKPSGGQRYFDNQ